MLLKGNGDQTFEELWPKQSGLALSGDSNGVAVADFDSDGDLDTFVAVNNEPLEILRNESEPGATCKLELADRSGNRNPIGASVLLEGSFGKQRFETYAGGSYLSQSSVELRISAQRFEALEKITVTWPDGTKTSHEPKESKDGVMLLEQRKTL